MIKNTLKPSILTLEDGKTYYGWSLTNNLISLGEIVFNTGMTGYQEIITDPSYYGQIITFTYPEIGNTGINKEDNESQTIYIKGIIAKNLSFTSSNWRSDISLIEYIKKHKIPHIFGIDTRALTKHLRTNGVMNGCISSSILNKQDILYKIKNIPKIEGCNLVSRVTASKPYIHISSESKYIYKVYRNHNDKQQDNLFNPKYKIMVLDFGVKQNIINILSNYNCEVQVVSANSTYNSINSYQPDGIVLSNGPGDPGTMQKIVKNMKRLIDIASVPIFGICMGHQILSLALGGHTFKLKFGHRGINHPIRMCNKAEITSQNHGFAVTTKSLLNDNIYVSHINLNDFTIAGMIHKTRPIFSVQYHPEASPGPNDSYYLFEHFINMVKLRKFKS